MKTSTFPLSAVLLLGFLLASSLRAQTVSVSAAPPTITNEGEEAVFTLTISPPSSRRIALNFFMSGTAALNSDYALLGNFNRNGQLIIPAGQASAMVTLHAFADDDRASIETAIFNIMRSGRYHVGSPDQAKVTIENQP